VQNFTKDNIVYLLAGDESPNARFSHSFTPNILLGWRT
jgi:hypothetical protein